jgi:hypothetical protein
VTWRAILGALAAAAAFAAAAEPERRIPNSQTVAVGLTAVPLNPADPKRVQVGALTYAWGARLEARGTSRFGGLSGLEVEPTPSPTGPDPERSSRAFVAVTDDGDAFRWTLREGNAGAGGVVQALVGRDGAPLTGKRQADAESLAAAPDGYYVGFEGEHRVWGYRPAQAGDFRAFRNPPIPARPTPSASDFSRNLGFEALAFLPGPGGGALAVGAEDGRLWLCPLSRSGCVLALSEPPQFGYWLTGLDHLPGTGDLVAVYRFYNPFTGATPAIVAHLPIEGGRARIVPLARLAAPMTVGNFEGIAAVEAPGGYRLYLVSDNGFGAKTPTLLLAFDWKR